MLIRAVRSVAFLSLSTRDEARRSYRSSPKRLAVPSSSPNVNRERVCGAGPCSRLSEEVPWPYNKPFPFHRFVLRRTQRNFPFGAGIVVIKSDAVGNLKVTVDSAIEASCIAGTEKLLRWGFADRANERHG